MALNPNDEKDYVWDWHNNVYVRKVRVRDSRGVDVVDFIACVEEPALGKARVLMNRYGLFLNNVEKCHRNFEEFEVFGNATLFIDTKGKVIGMYHHSRSIVASIPEWSGINWLLEEHAV